MTVVSMVRRQSDRKGWLWRKNPQSETWSKVFGAIKGHQLSFFRDDKAAQPSEVFSLSGSTVKDLGSEAGKPPGRSSRVLGIQIPSAEAEELRNLLPQCGLTFHADYQQLHLAASDNSEHTQWLKLLRQVSSSPPLANSVVVEEDKILNGHRRGSNRTSQGQALIEPAVSVSSYLCSPATSAGPELLPVLSRARAALKAAKERFAGLLNLGSAREEARKCQFALNSVRRQLREVDLSITHRQRDAEKDDGGASAQVMEVRDWLEQALNLMHDMDASLESLQMRDAPFAYEWECFAHNAMLKLQTVEEALYLGLYANQREQRMRESSKESGTLSKKSSQWTATLPEARPFMPYSHYKLKPAV